MEVEHLQEEVNKMKKINNLNRNNNNNNNHNKFLNRFCIIE